MIFIPCKVVLVVDILDDEVGGDKGDGDDDDDIMAMRMMGVIWVMMMMTMMMVMVSPCKVVLVVDILDDEVCVHSSLLLLPDDLVATSLENGFLMFFFVSLLFSTLRVCIHYVLPCIIALLS